VSEQSIPSYFINLDPAVKETAFNANIDIRDTVNYKEVMKQYSLGPNGGILTAMNLFSTRFDQVVSFIEQKQDKLKYVFLDTPGQIEIFTWSASGQIITESLASTYRTIVVYIMDTPRNNSPVTFMSNMLYACSIMYKMKLPFLLVFNKIDVMKHDFAISWMNSFDAFQAALQREKTYSSELAFSMSLVLDEFYKNLKAVGVSAVTGAGIEQFFKCVDELAVEYDSQYYVELEKKKKKLEMLKQKQKQTSINRLVEDLKQTKGQEVVLDMNNASSAAKSGNVQQNDNNDDDDEIDEEEEKEFKSFMAALDKQKQTAAKLKK